MFKLKKYFLIVGGGAFLFFTLAFIYASYQQDSVTLKRFGERENITLAGYLSNLLYNSVEKYVSIQVNGETSDLKESVQVKEINTFINDFSKKHAILKVKVFNLEGLTIYSTVPSEIGVVKEVNKGLKMASVEGMPHSEMAFKKEISSLSGSLFNRDIVETYIPIQSKEGQIIAVFELYSDVTELVQESRHRLYSFLGMLIIGYLILFGLLYIVVRRADSIIKTQYLQLNENNLSLESAKENLENIVTERTNELSQFVEKLKSEVNERKQAQLELSKLSIAVEQSPTSVLISDLEGNIQYVNPMFTEITGWTFAEIENQHTRILGSGKTPKSTHQKLWETILAGDIWKGEIYNKKKNSDIYLESVIISPIRDSEGKLTHFLSNSEDITQKKEHEERIQHLAHHDTLTGLFNRFSLEDRLDQSLSQASRSRSQLAVLFLDLDRFKVINDSLGHKAGDDLLIQVSDKLKAICRRESDIIARIGGDEFVIILSDLDSPTFAALTAKTIVEVISLPFYYEGHELNTSPSIGVSMYPSDGQNVENLLKNADTAMYHVKDSGRGNFQFYTDAMNQAVEEKLTLEKDLRIAMAENQFELYYQPQICTSDNKVCGVEALIRWHHPEQGFISPEKFIPIAEETGLIIELGLWVIHQAFKQAKEWKENSSTLIKMAINISPKQLESEDFVEIIDGCLQQYNLDPSCIELEVTESTAMKNPEEAIRKLESIRKLDIELAIDDFGTGHSSLAYLQQLPVQVLKLDRAFVMNIESDQNNATISIAAISLAHSLGFKVVAEGVETEGQAEFLKNNGCDMLQGYYYSKPSKPENIEKFIIEFNA